MTNEFLLEDRLQKIRSVISKYGQNNFYISFSGGKDSTVLSALVDMAIPGNTIPRVYANTGIELNMIRQFVMQEKAKDHAWELVILKPKVNIKQMLEEEGYPFKSKGHSVYVSRYQHVGKTKSVIQYLGESVDKAPWQSCRSCPNILRYQFTDAFKMKVSDMCCVRLKEDPVHEWQTENDRPYGILGIMASEGGRRSTAKCLAFSGNKLKNFQPLAPMTKEWEDWFIGAYDIAICDIYKPPYNFERTGCKGCPFALNLQHELDMLYTFFPAEAKQCEIIWKPVYDEYRRLGYRLAPSTQSKKLF